MMSTLRELKKRIEIISSTGKITSAMHMVSVSKFRKEQEIYRNSLPYYKSALLMLHNLPGTSKAEDDVPILWGSPGNVTLLLVITSQRGLCGSFNHNVIKHTKHHIKDHFSLGKEVKLLCIGRKGYEGLNSEFSHLMLQEAAEYNGIDLYDPNLVERLVQTLSDLYHEKAFNFCQVVFNSYVSAFEQNTVAEPLVPLRHIPAPKGMEPTQAGIPDFEPNTPIFLQKMIPHVLKAVLFKIIHESCMGAQAARMTAMDNATRNGKEMLKSLNVIYNKTRQANITRELIEIISGAEALKEK